MLSVGAVAVCTAFASVLPLQAQQPRISISADSARIGDPIHLRMTLPGVNPDSVRWPDITSGKLGDFSILQADTANAKARKKLGGPTLDLTIAAYDTGTVSTGELTIGTPAGQITSPGGTVRIVSVLNDSTGSQFRPLKAQEDLPVTFWDIVRYVGPWALGILAVVLLFLLVRRILRARRKMLEEDAPPPIPPYDEAVTALIRLKKDNPLARGDQKGYVSRLGQIVKRLLQRVHHAPVTEMTTGEVRRWVHEHKLRFDGNELLTLLDAADVVKFAKGALERGRAEELFGSAERMVEAYKPRPEDEEQGESDSDEGSSPNREVVDSPPPSPSSPKGVKVVKIEPDASAWRAAVPKKREEEH